MEILINGKWIPSAADGWYVDRDILTVPFDELSAGSNEIQIRIPYNKKRNVEAMYLLGDFGVSVFGSRTILQKRQEKLLFGDITRQGFPFMEEILHTASRLSCRKVRLRYRYPGSEALY